MHAIKNFLLALAFAVLPLNTACGADAPSYKDWVLTIPSVSIADQVGKYQDLTFNYTPQGVWQLVGLKSIGEPIGTSSIKLANINKVDVIKPDGFPTQVLLRVSGAYDPCNNGALGQSNQRMESNRFDVAITFNQLVLISPPATPVGCSPGFVNFVRTVPLSVYGLSAGTYSYNVNGTTGTFTLSADNKYPGDY